jgi:hypothetical protein
MTEYAASALFVYIEEVMGFLSSRTAKRFALSLSTTSKTAG